MFPSTQLTNNHTPDFYSNVECWLYIITYYSSKHKDIQFTVIDQYEKTKNILI